MGGVLALNTLGTTVSTVSTSWYGGGVPISTGGGTNQYGGGVPVDSRGMGKFFVYHIEILLQSHKKNANFERARIQSLNFLFQGIEDLW